MTLPAVPVRAAGYAADRLRRFALRTAVGVALLALAALFLVATAPGASAAVPASGASAAVPTDGSFAAAPTDGSFAAAPTDGSFAAVPTDGASAAAPTDGSFAVVPPVDPTAPVAPTSPTGADPTVSIDINGINGGPSSPIVVLLTITLLSVAPSLLLMMTSFTKIFVVLALTRNALGLTGVPPNQVLAGIALFLSLFIMSPVVGEVNDAAAQPYLAGTMTFSEAVETGTVPLREFMLGQTREADLALVTRAADMPNPENPEAVEMTTLIPAFMLSELRSAFIIGFVIFVPFLVIDLVVAASLMSMGMMMLPPVMVSLPFKLLLFVLVDGWGLIVTALVGSYR